MPAEGEKHIKEVKGLLYTTEYEFRPGRIRIEGDRIAEVDFSTEGELSEVERETLVLPGLVDVHFTEQQDMTSVMGHRKRIVP